MNFQVKLHLQRFARKLRAKRNIYELLLPTDDITKNLLCFQIIVGCRGVKSDLFVVSPSTHVLMALPVHLKQKEMNVVSKSSPRFYDDKPVSESAKNIIFKRLYDDDYCLE